MTPWVVHLDDVLDLSHINYSFTRIVRWKTIERRWRDQTGEWMPQMVLSRNEFHIVLDQSASWDQIAGLEQYLDEHYGSAQPFYFVAPDDGETYPVFFQNDNLEYTVPGAAMRQVSLVLLDAGDLINDIQNDLCYPSYTETINPILIETPGDLPIGEQDVAYTITLVAGNGVAPYTWSFVPGQTPPLGMSLSSSGVLSGTPLISGTFFFDIQATDSASGIAYPQGPASIVQSFQLQIVPGGSLVIPIVTGATFVYDGSGNLILTVTGAGFTVYDQIIWTVMGPPEVDTTLTTSFTADTQLYAVVDNALWSPAFDTGIPVEISVLHANSDGSQILLYGPAILIQ
jgi:hypothetical protein